MKIPLQRQILIKRGQLLEVGTLTWNILGIVFLTYAALQAESVALVGFGIDSVIEIGASIIVLWELSATNEKRQRRALRYIGLAFILLALYLLVQTVVVFMTSFHAHHSPLGVVWTGITALVMFGLAAGKTKTGQLLNNLVLITEGKVTVIDGLLAVAVLIGLLLNILFGWWWADPLAGLVIMYYAVREANEIFLHTD